MANRDYSIRQLLEASACTGCRLCADVCPAVAATRDGRLSGLYRLRGITKLARSRSGWLFRVLGKKPIEPAEVGRFGETVYKCTLCANCQEVCPVGLGLRDLWCSTRQDMVQSDASPQKIATIRSNLLEAHNVFGEENDERADWVEDLPEAPDHGYVRTKAEVVYFTGCVAAFYPLAQQIPGAVAEIMDALGVEFTLLAEDEWCCGFPLMAAGLWELGDEFIEHNVEAVKAKGARKIVFACPTCYRIWQEHYPPEFETAHFTEFIEDLQREKRLPLGPLPRKVTYHDPCDLGRGARVFDAPRRLIRLIPGVELVELPRNRENAQCCGGGGNLELIDPDLSAKITKLRIDEILSTGAQAVVTACQQCVRTMTTYVRRNEIPLEVLDITQLTQRALKRE